MNYLLCSLQSGVTNDGLWGAAQADPAALQHSLSAASLSAGMTHSMSPYYHPSGIAAHAHAAAVGHAAAAHHPAFLPPHHTARDFRDAGGLQVKLINYK